MARTNSESVIEATRSYEEWLGKHVTLLSDDLGYKHEQMRKAAFRFLRATFYRWVKLWPTVCPELAQAPQVLAVGDLHVENFGTWRDAEGRLVWGTNDFDEAYDLPFTMDLVRLATSALVAAEANQLQVAEKAACEAIRDGYEEALSSGGGAFVLEEKHGWLRKIANNELRAPGPFWEKMTKLPTAATVPNEAVAVLKRAVPQQGELLRIAVRRAGLGSLGRERYVALVQLCGGLLAREAKALAPSACVWAGYGHSSRIRYNHVLQNAVRSGDASVSVDEGWIVRRLAPHCTKIELDVLTEEKDELRLLHAMGWETANVHLGSGKAQTLLTYLRSLPSDWLVRAAELMQKAIVQDWQTFRREWA